MVMKFFCISDNLDTKLGMRLTGIDGEIVHDREKLMNLLNELVKTKDIGIVLITQKLSTSFSAELLDFKSKHKLPLLVTIPDRHGNAKISETIEEYIYKSVGIKI